MTQVVQPSKIVCIGRNYAEHAKELGNEVPKEPLIFLKPPSALLPPGGTIILPPVSRQVEFEGEIGVVIGKQAQRVAEAEAESFIAGYTCVNDVTCRDLQKTDGQWTRAKGFDTFCPAGPRVVSLDWRSLSVVTRVNGIERQRAPSSDMIFPIPRLVAHISAIMTLEPGDLIATGTPAGVGRLAAGDVVEVEIPGIGILSNHVAAQEKQ
jgi:2-keto-4-pentenoate hydratase/2-oxohepta-3-ene-1,7-dioic acid hydratase in catechol pathway